MGSPPYVKVLGGDCTIFQLYTRYKSHCRSLDLFALVMVSPAHLSKAKTYWFYVLSSISPEGKNYHLVINISPSPWQTSNKVYTKLHKNTLAEKLIKGLCYFITHNINAISIITVVQSFQHSTWYSQDAPCGTFTPANTQNLLICVWIF